MPLLSRGWRGWVWLCTAQRILLAIVSSGGPQNFVPLGAPLGFTLLAAWGRVQWGRVQWGRVQLVDGIKGMPTALTSKVRDLVLPAATHHIGHWFVGHVAPW